MEIMITGEATQIREKFIRAFVDTMLPYYRDYIEKCMLFSDGLCYTGYLWDCLKDKRPIPEDQCIRWIENKNKIYCFWDIHSKDRILIPNYWKYPKHSVLKLTPQELLPRMKYLPEDIYITDDTFEWCIAFTHEEDTRQKRYCLFAHAS